MQILLDTHILLWWLADDKALSKKARELIAEPVNVIFVSVVSVWEIAIKQSLGKLSAPDNLEQILGENQFEPLLIDVPHAILSGKLPQHHADPFDRMLIAQSQLEKLQLLTHDKLLKRYDNPQILV